MPELDIFINHKQLTDDSLLFTKYLRHVIPDIDIVVAIQRGGLLPSVIVSSILSIPLSTPDLVIKNEGYWTSSSRVDSHREYNTQDYVVKLSCLAKDNPSILLLDDISYNVMGTLERAKKLIMSKFPNAKVYKTSIYCMQRTMKSLDFYCKQISMEHWMEKDILIRRRAQKQGYDMDGVLCAEPYYYPNIPEEEWIKSLENTTPYMIPHYSLDYIITARNEKYRKVTEEWLNKYKVSYKELIMRNSEVEDHAVFKSKVISNLLNGGIYFESNYGLAKRIHDMTGVQVICTDTSELIGAESDCNYHPIFKSVREHDNLPESIGGVVNKNVKKHSSTWLFP